MPFDATPIETKPEVFSLERLIAWLEKQPAITSYDGISGRDCVFCRWLSAESGQPVLYKGLGSYGPMFGGCPYDLSALEYTVARARPHSYGAALTRARKILNGR